MGNAIWLLLALPSWYFETLLDPFSAGPLTEIPALGVVALIVGLGLAIISRRRAILLFLIPFLANEALVAVAGLFRGRVRPESVSWIILAFLIVQVALVATLIWKLKGARAAATALSLFSLSYALFACFVAMMSFTDQWL